MGAEASYVQMTRAPAFEPSHRKGFLQRQSASGAAESSFDHSRGSLSSSLASTAIPVAVRDVISSTGQPLDSGTRDFMESRFRHDFSQVRVHTDATAAESARAINARAYTVGSDVAFAANEFAPGTQEGRELLAHELAHTVQQASVSNIPPSPDREGAFEKSAGAAARDVADGRVVSGELPACGVGLSRAPGPDDERAKALAEAQAVIASIDETSKEDEPENEPTAKAKRGSPSSSKFLPGGFTDKDIYKEYDEATERMKLADLAIRLAEKQVKRHEFWDSNPSNNTADSKKAFALDLYWDPQEQSFMRQPYVTKQEDIINASPEAKRLYDDYLWNATENKPEKKGLVRRILDPPVHFVCKYTNPCSGIIEQMHRDRETGMDEIDVKKRAITRLTIEGATFALPGRGPSGPIDIGRGPGPGGGQFEVPALETGTPTAVEKPGSQTTAKPIPPEGPKLSTSSESPKPELLKGAESQKESDVEIGSKDPKTTVENAQPSKTSSSDKPEEVSVKPEAEPVRADPQQGVKAALERAKERLDQGNKDIAEYNRQIREAEKNANTPSARESLEELKAQRDHQVELNFGKNGHQATVARLTKALQAQTYARPTFTKALRAKVWEIASSAGKVLSPSGKEIKPGDRWIVGHKPKYEFWKHQRSAAERGLSREQFIEEYNRDPDHYRPETPEDSSSHKYEDKTDAYLGF